MDLAYIFNVIGSLIGIILLGMTYTYIVKMEDMGCECAEHPYRDFVKKYCLFAIGFLLITMFVPVDAVVKAFGPIGSLVFKLIKVAYMLATFVFFVLAYIYVRYLTYEKCKCSEDVRREILYFASIIEIVLLTAFFVIPLVIYVSVGSFALAMGTVKFVDGKFDTVKEAAVNPLASAKKLPKALSKTVRKLTRRG